MTVAAMSLRLTTQHENLPGRGMPRGAAFRPRGTSVPPSAPVETGAQAEACPTWMSRRIFGRITRRELLAGALAARAGQWTDDRLGIFCHLGHDERSARKTLAAARAAGFSRAQISFPWTQVNESYLSALPSWLKSEDVRAEVLSAYVNCAEQANVIMECRREDFARAIDLAGTLGCRCLVAWTGGYGAGLMKSDPRNFTPQAGDAIVRFLGDYTRRLEQARLALALETYITLACPDAPALGRLLKRLPICVGAVLDPPNLTPIDRYRERDQALREMVRILRDRVALVHLKDFLLAADGGSYKLPGPLEGEMNYPLFVELILSLPGAPPLVAEHLAPEQFAAARGKLLPLFRRGRRSQRNATYFPWDRGANVHV